MSPTDSCPLRTEPLPDHPLGPVPPAAPDAPGRRGPTARLRAWLGRLVARRIGTGGTDLSSLDFLPAGARLPLQRVGTDPVPELAALRSTRPVHRLRLPFDLPVLLVTGYAEARAVLTDRQTFSNDVRHLFGGPGPASADDIGGLGFTDPPLHTRLRTLVAPELTRHRLQRLEPVVEEIVVRRLDALAAAGSPGDLARHVSAPVPVETISHLLGLGSADREELTRLSSRRFDATGGAAAAFGAVSAQRRLLLDAVVQHRRRPGPGLLGQVIREHGDTVSDDELAGVADGVFTGGYETTAAMISLGTLVLLRDPASAAAVRDGSRRDVDRVVEELLRHLSVVQVAFPRIARHDTQLLGHHLRAGDVVLASLSGANRDPASAGERPEEFDPTRTPAAGHLAFGHGIHRCVGAELARLELRIVLPALLRRFPDLALAVPPGRLRFRELSFVFGVEELPVTFSARPRPAPFVPTPRVGS